MGRRAPFLEHQEDAVAALDEGRTLVVSNSTNLQAGIIHSGLAHRLVLTGVAEYLPDPEREGFKLETHIRKRVVT